MSTYEVVATTGGAFAMRDTVTGETMHPGTGCAVEPVSLYVEPSRLVARLSARDETDAIVLYDVGLGAGSNAVAAFRASEALGPDARRLRIVSFENDLSSLELAMCAEHRATFGLVDDECNVHSSVRKLLNDGLVETPRTSWRLAFGDYPALLAREPERVADIVFWDMYSTKSLPAMWSVESFAALRRACRDGATLHTYSVATSTRSAMLLAGFAVGIGRGTGMREGSTVAATHISCLDAPLDARWLSRLERSSAPFPPGLADTPETRAEAFARIRACPQFAQ